MTTFTVELWRLCEASKFNVDTCRHTPYVVRIRITGQLFVPQILLKSVHLAVPTFCSCHGQPLQMVRAGGRASYERLDKVYQLPATSSNPWQRPQTLSQWAPNIGATRPFYMTISSEGGWIDGPCWDSSRFMMLPINHLMVVAHLQQRCWGLFWGLLQGFVIIYFGSV